jgi:hypothetical protein
VGSAAVSGSRAAVLRRSEGTCFSSPSDDEVGGCQARSARSEHSERSNQTWIARRRAAPGWRAAVLDEGASSQPA